MSIAAQIDLAFNPAEPRDRQGRWVTLFHGTSLANAESIQQTGLRASEGHIYPAQWPITTVSRQAADAYASRGEGDRSTVEIRIPESQADEYLWPAQDHMGGAAYALKKDIPAKMIKAVHPVHGFVDYPLANTITSQIELAFNPAERRDAQGQWTRGALAAMSPAEKRAYIKTGVLPDRPSAAGGLSQQVSSGQALSGDELWMSGEGEVHDITPAEQNAARAVWYRDTYSYTNDYLRSGIRPSQNVYAQARKDMPVPEAEYIRDIGVYRGLIGRSPAFSRPARMYRGVTSPEAVFGPVGSRVGRSFTDPGLVSATTSNGEAADYSEGGDHIVINVPAGSRALRSEPDLFAAGGADYALNHEYTFAPGTRFRVDRDSVENGTRQTVITVLDAGHPGPRPAPHQRAFYTNPIGFGEGQQYDAETGRFVRNVRAG